MRLPVRFADAPWGDGPGVALVQGRHLWSRSELKARVLARVEQLRRQDLGPGHAVLIPDSPALDLLLMLHALARMGATLMPYRAGLPAAGLQDLADMVGAEWRWHPGDGRLVGLGHERLQADSEGTSLALLIKTSGSSGIPKVAMLTRENLLLSALGVNGRLELKAGDLWLACLRLSHVGGLSIAYRCALAGAAILLHEGFDAPAVRRDLWERPVTHLSLVPPMLARLLDLDPAPPPALRVLLVGGQALSRSLAQRALDAGWPLHLTYGMTETASQIATTARLTGEAPEAGLVGRLLPGIQVETRDCGLEPAPLRIRGPLLMAGYANPGRRSGQGLVDGWFETADLACVTGDGRLRVLGRADDIRVVGGNNVSLAAVEAQLHQAPRVAEVVVVGLPDEVWGHRLVAVFSGGADEAALDRWCRGRLPGPVRPRDFLRLDRLPLLGSGKYDRRRIEALASEARPSLVG